MPGVDERAVHGLTIRIDRSLCVGFGDCISAAPSAFALDAQGVAEFMNPDAVQRERLVQACDACPVDALTVLDAAGRQIVP